MQAIVYTKYGPPDVLQLNEVPKPTPGDDEVLVKIHAASANPMDWRFMRAAPFFMRFFSGLLKPKNKILGADIAGQVYELILDNVGNRSVSDIKRIMATNGTYLLNAYSPALMLKLLFQSGNSKTGGQTMRNTDVEKANQRDLEFLKALLEAGKVVPVIDRIYPLTEAGEAIRYLEEGHARGKVVITIQNNNKT